MKTEKKITGLAIAMLILFTAFGSYAQERRRESNGHEQHERNQKHDSDKREHAQRNDHYDHHHGDRSRHHHNSAWKRHEHPRLTPWSHAPRTRTRYVYFKDYNVYYDYRRHVYMSLAGRNWMFSTELPLAMRNVNVHHIVYAEVDYYGDDLYYYHTHNPHYVKIYSLR